MHYKILSMKPRTFSDEIDGKYSMVEIELEGTVHIIGSYHNDVIKNLSCGQHEFEIGDIVGNVTILHHADDNWTIMLDDKLIKIDNQMFANFIIDDLVGVNSQSMLLTIREINEMLSVP